jgi:hypothetical protein
MGFVRTDRSFEAGLKERTMTVRIVAASVLLVGTILQVQDGSAQDGGELRTKADEIRASADPLFKLRKIPWITDPAEGFRLAREENRPVFLYVQAGDPLEDC